MDVLRDRQALRALRYRLAAQGRRIALVPTMGNLHSGHLALVEHARRFAGAVFVSIYVNPLQFSASEDFGSYPRTEAQDFAKLQEAGVDAVLLPSTEEMYRNGYPPATTVQVEGGLTDILCGRFRPGHFAGVATVVNLLLNMVQPEIAVFGDKDYQQLMVIRRMVSDLGLPVEILGVPTVREADGLAKSSRNQYLDAGERRLATRIYATLEAIADGLRAGNRAYAELEAGAMASLRAEGFVPQYIEIRDPELRPPTAQSDQLVLLAAALLGRTRLIDNLTVRLGS